jgi:hypothetical protein
MVPSFSLEAKRCEKVACVGEAKYYKKGVFASFCTIAKTYSYFTCAIENEKNQIIKKEPNK